MNRILTAIVLIAFVIGLVFFGKLWMITLLCALVAGLPDLHEHNLQYFRPFEWK